MAARLALTRAAHLHDYISVLRDLGAPIDRDLARSRLPQSIEENADLYVSIPVGYEFLSTAGRDLEPMELGLLAAQKASLSSLRPDQQIAIITAPSGFKRLESLGAIARIEDSSLRISVQHEGDNVRVFCDIRGLRDHPYVCLSEWLDLQAVISVVRSVVGPSWSPSELCFVSSYRVPEAVSTAFPDTRIRMGQPRTSVLVGRGDLAQPCASLALSPRTATDLLERDRGRGDTFEAWELVILLRRLIQPYLADRRPDVAFIAEIAGITKRTLQRRLAVCGSSFSKLLQEASYDLACHHLGNTDMRIIDVAMMTGYEHPQHFARAFQRFSGMTPSEYRARALSRTIQSGHYLDPCVANPGISLADV